MPVDASCECGKKYRLPDSTAGKKIKCKSCGAAVAVPGVSEPSTQRPRKKITRPIEENSPANTVPKRKKTRQVRDEDESPRRSKKAKREVVAADDEFEDDEDHFAEPVFDDELNDSFGEDDFPSEDRDDRSARRRRRPRGRDSERPRKKRPSRARPSPDGEVEPDADDEETSPWAMLGWGIVFAVIGIAMFVWFGTLEEEGGRVRVPRLIWLVYQVTGKWGVLIICEVIGLAGIAIGIADLAKGDGKQTKPSTRKKKKRRS